MPRLLCAVLAAVLFSDAPARAADARVLESAKQCTAIAPAGDGGLNRAEWHRRQVACLKDLYVMIGMPDGGAAAVTDVRARLDDLETAYYNSRALCGTQEKHEGSSGGCGTMSLAPAEFRRLLKAMIINADAGWVKEDPHLVDALNLRE